MEPNPGLLIKILALAALIGLAGCAETPEPARSDTSTTESNRYTESNSEPVVSSSPKRTTLFWGDLHIHSNLSLDAYAFGNLNLSPTDLVRFARGEKVTADNGEPAQLARPLDFILVADHAEYLGILTDLVAGDPALAGTSLGQRWRKLLDAGDIAGVVAEYSGTIERSRPLTDYVPKSYQQTVWHRLIDEIERLNEPGKFTAFFGYEWTSMVAGGNLHRVVVFKDGPEKVRQVVPFSALDSLDPEDLWSYLAAYEDETGGSVMAIPHNGNLSTGLMFGEQRFDGSSFDRRYAETRARWEPLYEMTQVKGDAEAHPLLSPEDPFADFENWDETDVRMGPRKTGMDPDALRSEYARSALKKGLSLQAELGVNPFEFGMIGSTDSHTALSTADDDNFFGKFLDSEPSPQRLTNRMGGALWFNRELTASGYAAVWAEENTRASIFDALKRREAYASTGPRISVRFFGAWDFVASDVSQPDYVARGYDRGVPMGGRLSERPPGVVPTFMVTAMKDPAGANLDRLQIVKGWLTADGTPAERVYDVAWAGDREPDAQSGLVPDVGSTVDISTATYENTIGASTLSGVWEDPAFDPQQPAFYYARVIEIPTPRWTTYDAHRYGLPVPSDVPPAIQERAYTSPIWYKPVSSVEQ